MTEPLKTISSTCGRYRAEIVRRTGCFQVKLFRWTEEWVPGYGEVAEFWEPASHFATMTDTLERAEELAAEEFRSLGAASPERAEE